jgi:hypothetical protein
MGTQNPLPDPNPQPQGQVLPPAGNNPSHASVPGANFAQFTATAGYVPPNVWTEQTLLDFHEKQRDVILDNNRILNLGQWREFATWFFGLLGIFCVIAAGLWFAYIGNPLGKEIILGTMAFFAGLLAGRGTK